MNPGGNLGKLFVSLGVDVTGLIQAQAAMQQFTSQADKQIRSVQASLRKFSTDLKTFGGDATRNLTIPLTLTGGAGMKTFKDYELTLAHIEGLTGTSAETTKQWDAEIRKLATTVAKTPQELGQAMYFIASSGIDASKALDVLNISAKASAAGLGTSMQVADLLTSALNAYAKENLTASQAADILTAAVREGKIEATSFAEHVGYVIPVAAEMGVSFDQVAAAMAAMSTTGADASTAATQLRQLLSDILKPAMQSEHALEQFGMSGKELRRVLREQGLLAALGKVRDIVTQFGEDAVAKVFPEVRALTGVLMLIGQNSEHVAEIFNVVKNSTGDMQKAFDVASKTLDFRYNQALVQVKLSLIELGNAMKGPLTAIFNAFIERLKSITQWFTGLSETQQKLILTLGATLAVIGPLSYSLGGLITVLNGVLSVFKALVISVTANPFMALAGVLSLAAAAFIHFANKVQIATDARKEILDVTGKNITKIEEETATVYGLFAALKSVNEGTIVRKNLINYINTEYKQYLPSLITEKTSLAEINAIEKSLIQTMQSRLALQMQSEQINKILTDQIKRNNQVFQQYTTKEAPLSSWIAAYQDFIKVGGDISNTTDQVNSSFRNASNGFKTYQKATETWTSASEEVNALSKVTGINVRTLSEIFKGLSDAQREDESVIKELTKQYANYITTATAGANAIAALQGKSVSGGVGKQSIFKSSIIGIDRYKIAMDDLNETLSKQKGTMLEYTDVSESLQNALATIALKNSILGAGLSDVDIKANTLAEQIRYVSNEMEKAGKKGFEEPTYKMQVYIEMLKKLRDEQDNVKISAFEVGEIIYSVAIAFESAGDAILKASQDGKINFVEAMNIISTIALQTIGILGALAAANIITKEAQKGIVGVFTAIAGVAILAATWATLVNPSKYSAHMKEGGVVPPGYPNDSYPAWLSSGETITPPNKIPMKNISSKPTVIVLDSVLKGTDIHFIVKEVDRRYNNSY